MRGVHGVARSTSGEVLFPAGLAVLAATQPSRALWVYGTLVMGISDAVAGTVGEHFGKHRVSIGAARKSVEGSVAFFVTTTVIGTCTLRVAPAASARPALVAASSALMLTAVEVVLPWGLDNLVLPTASAAALWALSSLPW